MRILGWLAMALGLIGIVLGLAFAVGVWVVRPNIQASAHELVVAADAGLGRGIELTGRVSDKLGDVSARIGDLKAKADELVAAPTIAGTLATGLATAVSDFVSGPYASWRADYVALRERVTSVGEVLRALDAAIPAVTLPGVAMERLANLDAKLVQIDGVVMALGEASAAGLAEPGGAAQVSAQAAQAQQSLATVGEVLSDVDAKLQDTRHRLADSDDRIATLLTVGAGVGTIAGLYLAGLNVLLFQQGRRWSRRTDEPPG